MLRSYKQKCFDRVVESGAKWHENVVQRKYRECARDRPAERS